MWAQASAQEVIVRRPASPARVRVALLVALGSYWPHRASIRPWTLSRTTSTGLRSAALWQSPLSSCHPWRWTGTGAGAIGAPPMAAQSEVTWGTGQNGLILRWRASR